MFVSRIISLHRLGSGKALIATLAMKPETYLKCRVLNEDYNTGALAIAIPIPVQLNGTLCYIYYYHQLISWFWRFKILILEWNPFVMNIRPPAMIELPYWDLDFSRSFGKFFDLLLVHCWWEVRHATHGSLWILGHPNVPGKRFWVTRKKHRWENQMRILVVVSAVFIFQKVLANYRVVLLSQLHISIPVGSL